MCISKQFAPPASSIPLENVSSSMPELTASASTKVAASEATNNKSERKRSRAASHHHQQHQHHQHHPHIVVQHNYHDHAQEEQCGHIDPQELNMRCSATTPFPIKLYEMLERVEGDGNAHICSWQPHGRCFVIHKPREFKDLLPRYFKLSKIASFQRQLNLYGFQRLTQGLDKGGYYHELFLRGKAFLAYKIQRIKIKGTGVRGKSNPEQEPDFWSMSWVGGDAKPDLLASPQEQRGLVAPAPAVAPNMITASETQPQQLPLSFAPPASNLPQQNTKRRVDAVSVVSHEEHHQPQRVGTPIPPSAVFVPLGSSASSSVNNRLEFKAMAPPPMTLKAPCAVPSAVAADVILEQWGKPFHALDVLPDDVLDRARALTNSSSSNNNRNQTFACQPTTNACHSRQEVSLPGEPVSMPNNRGEQQQQQPPQNDFDDELYMDSILHSMLMDSETMPDDEDESNNTSSKDADLAHLLETIIAC